MEIFDGEPLRHMGDLPAMAAHRYPEQVAFEAFGQEVTYSEVDEKASKVANVLVDEGVEPGDRVVVTADD